MKATFAVFLVAGLFAATLAHAQAPAATTPNPTEPPAVVSQDSAPASAVEGAKTSLVQEGPDVLGTPAPTWKHSCFTTCAAYYSWCQSACSLGIKSFTCSPSIPCVTGPCVCNF
jgi:hypothetical protein